MGVSGAKEVKFTTGLPLLQEEKINIELKFIDGVPANITVGMPFLFAISINIFGNKVKNIQYVIDSVHL